MREKCYIWRWLAVIVGAEVCGLIWLASSLI